MLNFNSIEELKSNGFLGFKTIESLWIDRTMIPKLKGVYLVLNKEMKGNYINPGVGGFFKGKDPNVPVDILKENFIDNSLVVYIGKAGSLTGKATLYSRIGQYLSFGKGKNIGHWGGRYIWQLQNYKNLILCWKTTTETDPRQIEIDLLKDFTNQFGKLPYANINK